MKRFLVFILSIVCFIELQAKESISTAALEAERRLSLFTQEIEFLLDNLSFAKQPQLIQAEKQLKGIENKWNVYSMANDELIASEEGLLQAVETFEETKQLLIDSINSQLHKLDSYDKFVKAEGTIHSQLESYQDLYNQAQEYSLVKSLASLLEKLQTKEQLTASTLATLYEESKTIAEEYPTLKNRMEKVEQDYVEIKGISEKIQALEYKPFLGRIKDYLYSLAAIAMLLMFVNMIQTKIQAFNQMKKNEKQYKELLKKNEEEMPSI